MPLLPQKQRKRIDLPNTHLNVCSSPCKRCLFGKKPHIPWEPHGREKIEGIVAEDQVPFTCHEYQNVQCHGYWMRHGRNQWFGRLAKKIDSIRWIDRNT